MKWVGRARGWETMKMNKKYVGNSVLVAWFIFGMWAGMEVFQSYGAVLGSLFPAYLMVWVLVIFQGRFAIEWVINKLWVTS